jgi:hypothetical protein
VIDLTGGAATINLKGALTTPTAATYWEEQPEVYLIIMTMLQHKQWALSRILSEPAHQQYQY